MPFKKQGNDDYTGPSGRHFNAAQVRLYYSNGGKFPGQKEDHVAKIKGSGPVAASYALGGPVTGRTREFMKEPMGNLKQSQDYGKSGPGEQGKDKSLKAIKPKQ